jgi:hypothetical protein
MRVFVNCVLFLAFLLATPAISKQSTKPDLSDPPMKVVIVRDSADDCEPLCPQWISAEGRITSATPALFKKAIAAMGKARLPVLIQSGGGEVRAALQIGRMIREHNLDVAVGWTMFRDICKPDQINCKLPKEQSGVYHGFAFQMRSYCNSACPLILAAGKNRFVANTNYIGVHQILNVWTQGDRITYRERYLMVRGKKQVISRTVVARTKGKSYTTNGLTKGLRKELTNYLDQMGIATSLFDHMDKAPPTSIYWMNEIELEKTKLITSRDAASDLVSRSLCKARPLAPLCVLHFRDQPKS